MIFPNEILDMIYYKSDYATRNKLRQVSKYLRINKRYNRLFRLETYTGKWNKHFFYLQELLFREISQDIKHYQLYEYDCEKKWCYVSSSLENKK